MLSLSHKELIKDLLSRPDAPIILNEANEHLKEEIKRRQQFYNDITEYEKAEFINGEIIIHSPVKKEHNDVSVWLSRLISTYVSKHQLGYVGYEKIMIALTRNDYEPDICFFEIAKSKEFKKGQSLFPAPDLVVEVLSKGTAANDRGVKFEDYQLHGVLEYWLIDPVKQVVEQYRLTRQKKYELILKAKQGMLECKAIKGFKIKIEAIFDEKENLAELGRILSKK